LAFVGGHPDLAFISMGAVVLAVTGAEALYADVGHFGKAPIRLAWFALVFPALTLNYLGQAALLLRDRADKANPFFLLMPQWARLPSVILATAATIIASQAVISGTYSMTRQAVQLGFLPPMEVRHTSRREAGQIYMPAVNWALFVGVLVLVLTFRSSSRLADAYGIAVTGTFLTTTCMVVVLARVKWNWPTWRLVLMTAVFAGLEIPFFAGNIVKVVDGGNSYYRDDIRRAGELSKRGIHLIDCGTSGGVWGIDRGYCLMIGGESGAVKHLGPIFATIAPGIDSAARTPGRTGKPDPAERGFLHCGPHGAGHFVKMVHNGIEYGMMASFAEGLNILHNANAGTKSAQADAETAPMEDPEFYQFDIDTTAVTEVWRRGSVIESWLLDLIATALFESPELEEFTGRVSDSGEGRWTSIAAIDEGVPAPVLTTALYSRFASRGLDDFADQVLSAMRKGFGGHDEKQA